MGPDMFGRDDTPIGVLCNQQAVIEKELYLSASLSLIEGG